MLPGGTVRSTVRLTTREPVSRVCRMALGTFLLSVCGALRMARAVDSEKGAATYLEVICDENPLPASLEIHLDPVALPLHKLHRDSPTQSGEHLTVGDPAKILL